MYFENLCKTLLDGDWSHLSTLKQFKQTNRQTDKQTNKQTNRQTNKISLKPNVSFHSSDWLIVYRSWRNFIIKIVTKIKIWSKSKSVKQYATQFLTVHVVLTLSLPRQKKTSGKAPPFQWMSLLANETVGSWSELSDKPFESRTRGFQQELPNLVI